MIMDNHQEIVLKFSFKKMSKTQLKKILTLNPETYLELFDLYIDESYGFVRFHSGKNFNADIVYKGNTYLSCPLQFSGAENTSTGKLPRPKLIISNIKGFITNYIKNKKDLNNSSIKRTRVYLKNIDDVNFPESKNPFFGYQNKWSFPNFGPELYTDSYVISSKVSENKYEIELELSSPLDLENVFLPSRVILDTMCPFVYRGAGCCYGKRNNFKQTILKQPWIGQEKDDWVEFDQIGIPVADEFDKAFLSAQGYNLPTLKNKGVWSNTYEYTTGDFVLVQSSFSYDFNKPNIQESSDDLIGDYFVCIKTGVLGVNPRLDKESWIKDSCSKSIRGCEYRYADYYNMFDLDTPEHKTIDIPFGGFPGTRPYEYRVD